jgi:hypothetical protein
VSSRQSYPINPHRTAAGTCARRVEPPARQQNGLRTVGCGGRLCRLLRGSCRAGWAQTVVRVRDRPVTADAIMTRMAATTIATIHRTQSMPGLPLPPNAA